MIDSQVVIEFLPSSNKQLRTHGKNFQGSHASGTAPESCLVNHEADTSIFHKHHRKIRAVSYLYRCLPVLSRWPVIVTTMAALRSTSATITPGAEQMMVDIHRSSDGGLDVRNPHALKLADSMNSELFALVGNTLITS